MVNIIQSLIEYITRKKYEKWLNIFSSNSACSVISEKKYCKLINYMRTHKRYGNNDYTETFWDYNVVHIKDENLSKLLYKQVSEEGLSGEDNKTKYIVLDGQKKLVFVVCSRANLNLYSIYKDVQTFCNRLSNEEYTAHIDYSRLFDVYDCEDRNFILSLFSSIVLGEYTLTQEELKCLIPEIIDEFDGTANSFATTTRLIGNDSGSVNTWKRRGVYLEENREYFGLPKGMEINMYRLIVAEQNGKQCFENSEEFFKDWRDDGQSISNIIFDEEAFLKTLQYKEENDSYIVYIDKTFEDTYHSFYNYCMKLRDASLAGNVCKVIDGENSKKFGHAKVLYTLQGDVYVHWQEHKSDKLSCVHNNIPEIIYAIVNTFSMDNYIKKNIFFKSGTNLLDCVCYSSERGITFTNLQCISFNRQASDETFEYSLLVMQFIKHCLDSKPNSRESIIYSCMKIFPPDFQQQLNEYLQTGKCAVTKLQKCLNNILEVEVTKDVMFFGEIKNSQDFEYITAFSNSTDLSDNIKGNIQARISNISKNTGKYGEYACFDSIVENMFGEKPMYLTQRNVTKLISSSDNPYLLKAVKLVISEESFDNNRYRLIGAVLNRGRLYNLYDLISRKALNTKEIYTVIYKMLRIHNKEGYILRGNAIDIIKNVFVDNSLEVYFGCSDYVGRDSRLSSTRYYTRLIEMFVNADIYLDCVISADDMFYNVREIGTVLSKINGMKLCPEHNAWHLDKEFCDECKKIYELYDEDMFEESSYNNGVVNFYELEYTTSVIFPGVVSNLVKLGIQNNLYEKFTGIIPRKLLVHSTEMSRKTRHIGILYDDFDFTGVTELEDFKQLQRMKVVLILLKQIYPCIIDGSFVCTNKHIYNTMIMHRGYKGQIIIPEITLLETDVILSDDTNLKEKKKKESLNLFFNFMYEYLMKDEYLKIDKVEFPKILRDIQSQKIDQKTIMKYLEGKNSYCKVHKINFDSNKSICPACELDGILPDRVVVKDLAYFDNLESSTSQYEGGEANLYPYGKTQIQKIFNSSVDLELKSKIIGKAIEKQTLFTKFNKEHSDIQFVTIDKVLYSCENSILTLKGYTQELIENSYKISSLKDKHLVAERSITKSDVVDILIKVCVGIQFLHSIGCFIGDLNGGNILIKGKKVYFIDFDGMSMDDVKNNVYTNMYIYPPSAEAKNITKDDDWYSLAVQAFYYLTYSHPFRGICSNYKVPENEMERMKQRKSVLGNHGIVAPSMCEGWDTLPKPLIQHFLATFEGPKRTNMLELLVSYKTQLEEMKLLFKEIERQGEVSDSLSEDLYIDSNGNLLYKEKVILEDVTEFKCMDEGYFIQKDNTYFVTMNGKVHEFKKSYNISDVLDVYDEQIFYRSEDRLNLFVDTKDSASNLVKSLRVPRATSNQIICLKVIKPNVLLIVEFDYYNKRIELYCNNNRLWTIPIKKGKAKLDMAYDSISEKCLLKVHIQGDNFAYCALVNSSMQCSELTIPIESDVKHEFHGNVLYWTENGKICCYNVLFKRLKYIECEVAKPNATVRRKGNTFYIGNGAKSYLYTKS